MKRLTINQIARANLRQNRRSYLSMAVSIFVAVFLAASLCLSVQGILARRAEDRAATYGRMDMFTVNDDWMSDEELLETGFFRPDIGHVYVTAEIPDISVAIGYYDEVAVPLMNRTLVEGRMPEMPGEIALEQSALDRLRVDSGVGDSLTLSVTPVDGLREERTYTIVGILTEQTMYLDISQNNSFGSGSALWPAILTCEAEPGFASGNVTIHRLLMLRAMVTKHQALTAFQFGGPYQFQNLFSVTDDGEVRDEPYFFLPLASLAQNTILLLIYLLGGSLLIAVCTAISGAMESQLARKTEEIGMLRAVGATKRQIRRIFGRESWLIALTVSPAALLLACGFTWALSLIAPTYVLFRPALWVLLPVLLLVTVVILISSSLPLRRASHIMPMSVLRDTAILRKAKRIRSRKRFKVPALVSQRMLTLHPGRLIGSVLLVAAMLVMSGFGAAVIYRDASLSLTDSATFMLGSGGWSTSRGNYSFSNIVSPETLNEADLNQLASLPGVSKVLPFREMQVCFEIDTAGEYFASAFALGPDQTGIQKPDRDEQLLALESEYYSLYSFRDRTEEGQIRDQMDLRAAQSALGTEKQLVNMTLTVQDFDLKELEPYVTEGKLDIDAINAGREVIVYAPTYYMTRNEDLFILGTWNEDTSQIAIPNDSLFVGQTLPIAQFYETNGDRAYMVSSTQAEYDDFYQTTNLRRATVTIGALIEKFTPQLRGACILTSEQGLRAMGLQTSTPITVDIYLSGTPDEETEAYLTERVNSIASRGGMPVRNYLEINREWQTERMQIIVVFLCITAIFFSAAVGLICGNVSRRLRADSRMIGTLRAVGADDRALIGCYSGSILISIGLGAVISIAVLTWMVYGAQLLPAWYGGNIAFLPLLFLAALLLGCCLWVLRLRVKDVIKKSIVENIKEL